MNRWAESPSKTLVCLAASFAAGVAVHAWQERPWATFLTWALLTLVTGCWTLAAWSRPHWRLVLLCGLSLLLGLWRYDAAVIGLNAPVSIPEGKLELTGQVIREPRRLLDGEVLVVGEVRTMDGVVIPDLLRLRLRGLSEHRLGDRLSWSCRPRPAAPYNGRRWRVPIPGSAYR